MRFDLAFLVGELEKKFSVQVYGNISRDIIKIERLPADISEVICSEALYIATPVGLEKMGTIDSLAPILCVAEQSLLIDQSLFPGKSVVVVRSDDISKVMLDIADIMYELGLRSSKLSELAKSLLCCNDFNQMLEVGFVFLGNPIIVVDSHQKIIGYTKPEDIKDALGINLSSSEYKVDSVVTTEQIQQEYKKIFRTSAADSQVNFGGDSPGACKKLIAGGRVEGYLQVLAIIKPLSDYDYEAAAVLGNFLVVELLRIHVSNIRETETGKAEAFLKTLLDSSLVNRKAIAMSMEALQLKFKNFLYVLTIQTQDRPEMSGSAMQRLIELLTYQLIGTKGFIYENSMILLYSADQRIADFKAAVAPLIPILTANGLQAGISNAFFSIIDIRAQYFQARKAVEIGSRIDPGRYLYTYEGYSVYHMMELSSTFDNLMCFCHSSIFNLLEHDGDIAGELITTLYTYLKSGSNKIKTSKELHVHLNTIKYRLTQISEILGVNLADEEIAFSLYHSLKIV
ncbi:MAG: putative transcriptional regulator, PucR family, partial [Firmicutes bacterium]|nr:putative transcriptional regulator, PucR family [Bacillota bacterium]